MKTSSISQERITKAFRNLMILTALSILTWLYSSCATAPQPGATATATPTPAKQMSEEEKRQEDWRISMAQTQMPKNNACFEASYPNKEWREVTCVKAPPFPQPPKRGPRPQIVGGGDDVSPQVPSGFIQTGIGSFDSGTVVTGETGQNGGGGPQVANSYTLQLNSDFFPSTTCAGSPNPGCRGWEQFIFANDGTSGFAFIQYWLLQYNTTCPAGWNTFSFSGSTDIYCWRNSTNASGTANQPISNLTNLTLTGTVSAGGDSYAFSSGGSMVGAAGDNSVNAAAGWTAAEFCVVGNCCGSQANFSNGTTLVPRTRVIYGGTAAPMCLAQGFTGETNNLSFGPTAPAVSPPGPALFATETNAGGAMSNCAAATTVGDTHLHTFSGLFYDFQATGDFLLLQSDPNFAVQTRQVSGAPTWPNAAVNKAVATQMRNDKVSICLAPTRVNVNGTNKDLPDGSSISTPDGVDVTRKGNIYFISDADGDSVRATVNTNPDYIDVSTGVGHWPAKLSGLLANPSGNVNQLAKRDGTVLAIPFSYEALYQGYADSWRVSPRESLLSACSEKETEHGVPQKLFFANDLDPQVSARTRAVCVAAGVKEGPLLDACTLDVAVIGNDAAAKVFVGARDPSAVGNITTSSGRGAVFGAWWWWLLLLLLVLLVIVVILWIVRKKKKTP